jgi:hypothetical protein
LLDVLQAADQAAKGHFQEAFKSLGAARNVAPALADKAQRALERALPPGLTPADLVAAGAAIPKVVDTAKDLRSGQLGKAVEDVMAAGASAPALVQGALKAALNRLGVSQNDATAAGAAAPQIVSAAEKAAHGDVSGAIRDLGAAAAAAPELVAHAVAKLAARLPSDPKFALAKSLLSNPKIVQDLVGSAKGRQALGKLASGDVVGALKGAAEVPGLLADVANVLAKNPAAAQGLKAIGVDTPEDIAKLGSGIVDALRLVEDVGKKSLGGAIQDLGMLAGDIPPGLADKLLARTLAKLGVPRTAQELLGGVLKAGRDPDVAGSLAKAVGDLEAENPRAFVQDLTQAQEAVLHKSPELAVGFLDSLGKIKAPIGRLFANHALNETLVKAGASGHVFQASQRLVDGDITGALGELGNGLGSLLAAGEPITVGGVVPLTLPIGREGLKASGQLVSQFVQALPPSVQRLIDEKVAAVIAKEGLASIPVAGPLLNAVRDGSALAADIRNRKDGLTIGLEAAELVVDGASVVPVLEPAVAPLRVLLAVGKAGNEIRAVVRDVKDFGKAFALTP